MNCLKNSIICFLIASAFTLTSQNPFYKNINKSNGLISNTVYDIIQSKEGFIFAATDKGLVRYDGVNFLNYKTPTKNSKAVSNLIEIENGDIYCQNFIGEIFHTKVDKLVLDNYLNPTGNYYAMRKWDNYIVAFNIDTLKLYDYKKGKLKKFNSKNAYAINSFANQNTIYCMDIDYNLLCFKDTAWNVIYKNYDDKLKNVFHLEQLKQGILFFKKTDNSTVRLLKDNKIIEVEGIKENVFINNIKNVNGKIWICTTSGLYIFDEDFKSLNNDIPYFQGYNVSSIIEDREGAYWVSTIDRGLIYVPSIDVKEYGKLDYQFSAISKYQNNILLGTYDNKILNFNINSKRYEEVFYAGYSNEINSVVYDSINDCIIAGSANLFFIKNKKILYSQTMGVKDIKLTRNQVLLTAFSAGSNFFKPPISKLIYHSPTFTNKKWDNNLIEVIPSYNYRTRAIEYFNTDSLIFVANSKGVFKVVKSIPQEIKFNDSSIIASSLFVSDKKLFIGTFSNGIYQYDFLTNSVKEVLLSKHIIKTCLKIKVYKEKIYLINDDGLFCIDESNNDIKHWGISDGLNTGAELKDFLMLRDTVFIASNQGLVVFPSDKNYKNLIAPNIIINTTLFRDVQNDSILYLDNLGKDLSIQFSVISFKGQDSIKVFYRINDDDWILLSEQERKIQLSYLAPGKYNIKIKALNEDGVEFVYPGIIRLVVKPPFYQSWWFISILAFLSLGLGLWINKYRLRKLMQKQKEELDKQLLKQQIDLSTLKTLRAQMNPHFIFNALNSIQSYVYSGDKELAGKYLSLFSDLSRSLLDNSAQTEVSLYDELKLIDLYLQLESIRLPKIKYNIYKDDDLNTHDIHIPAMIIQPIVENAIKHGLANKSGDGFVNVRVLKRANSIIFEIEDNGIGRLKSTEFSNRKNNKHQSFATQAIENRIILLNKNSHFKITQEIIDKFDDNKIATGTLVKISIPLNYEYEMHHN